jgi:hypothetical protein
MARECMTHAACILTPAPSPQIAGRRPPDVPSALPATTLEQCRELGEQSPVNSNMLSTTGTGTPDACKVREGMREAPPIILSPLSLHLSFLSLSKENSRAPSSQHLHLTSHPSYASSSSLLCCRIPRLSSALEPGTMARCAQGGA